MAQPVTNAALPATLLALLGESEQKLFPGPSLDALWMNSELGREWPNPLAEIAQIPWAPEQHLPAHGPMKAVVSPHWHYVIHQVFGQELYDWQNDPEESTDLSENPEYPPVANEFNAYLETLMPGLAAWPK
jgi:arylsulfatase A-like enzyme